MDLLPPACYCHDCAQIGEPYDHVLDSKTGRYRPVYSTFKKFGEVEWKDGIWEYCGHCFCGENKERESTKEE